MALPCNLSSIDKSFDRHGSGRLPRCTAIMNPSDPTPRQSRRESATAFSIISFALALLCFLLGWADGVRHDRTYLHIPETGGWLVATAIFAGIGVAFFIWSRGAKRS